MSSDPHLDWIVAWAKYVSCCQTGGTREQRVWAFARAMDALEGLMEFERRELKARSKTDTQEVEAV